MKSLFGEGFGDDFGVGPRGGHHLPILTGDDLAGDGGAFRSGRFTRR